MNEYILKYGQNAIQAYKKSLRLSQSLQKHQSSPFKQQSHLLPKKSLSKRSLKSKKSQSQTKLAHSKSIRNVSKLDDDCRKKTSSFIQGSKKLISPSMGNNNMFQTFNKLNLGQGKKKLTISQTTTPKNSTKFQFNLNLSKQPQQKSHIKASEIRDKLTQRIERSSSKKNMDKCSTSQSKYQQKNKRYYLAQAENRLQEIVSTTKKGLKYVITGVRQVMDIVLSSQEDIKLRKVFMLIKEVIERLINVGEKYKCKYHRATQRINSLQMIHKTYISSDIQPSTKHNSEFNSLKNSNKKSTQIQTIILNQNYQLRKKIHKLEKQLEYYTSQSASLMNVFGKFQQSQAIKDSKRVTFQKSPSKMQNTLMSGNKIEKRRSSQNLIYYSPQSNLFINPNEKRLSFDPSLINLNNQMKKKLQASLYSSVGSSISNNEPISNQKQQYPPHFNYHQAQNQDLEQLSQQQDSDNQE